MEHSPIAITTCLAASLIAAAAASAGTITPIDAFTGDRPAESFENVGTGPGNYPGNGPPEAVPLFGEDNMGLNAAGTVIGLTPGGPPPTWTPFVETAGTTIIITSLTDTSETHLPFHGNLMGMVATGWGRFDFDPPIVRFGGYWGANPNDGSQGEDIPNAIMTFFDEGGVEIGTATVTLADNEWRWNGWESDTPIARIDYLLETTAPGGKGPATFDLLEIAYPAGCKSPAGDLDGNCVVNLFDLLDLLAVWGACDDPCPPSCPGDVTNSTGDGTDCAVNIFDLLQLLANWG